MAATTFPFQPQPPYAPSPAGDPPRDLSQSQQNEWRNRTESKYLRSVLEYKHLLISLLTVHYHTATHYQLAQKHMRTIRRQPTNQQASLIANMQVSAIKFIEENINGKIPYPVKRGNSVYSTYASSRDPKRRCDKFFRLTLERLERIQTESREGTEGGVLTGSATDTDDRSDNTIHDSNAAPLLPRT